MEILSGSPFSSLVGPIEVTWDPRPVFETFVRDDCSNTMGRVHGGFLAALIDITTGQGVGNIQQRRIELGAPKQLDPFSC